MSKPREEKFLNFNMLFPINEKVFIMEDFNVRIGNNSKYRNITRLSGM